MIWQELFRFLFVGSLTVLVDFLAYHFLLWADLLKIDPAKTIGFLCGALFAYFANRIWTFAHKQPARGGFFRFALLYSCTLGTNVLVNRSIISMLQNTPSKLQIAFLIATTISAALNFIGMKWFAFKSKLATSP